MSKRQILIIIGAAIVIMPFLGFPPVWQKFFIVVLGLATAATAYSTAPRIKPDSDGDAPFSEHKIKSDNDQKGNIDRA